MQFENIKAAIESGDLTAAESLCRQQLLVQPNDEDLMSMLAISLHLQQRVSEAIAAYARLTELFPDNGVYWANFATALRSGGFRKEAEENYQTSIRLDPHNPVPRVDLGLMMIERKDYLGAREMLLDAFDLDRQLPLSRVHGARACCLCQDFNGAQDLLRPWRQWLPLRDDAMQSELAKLLILLTDISSAQVLLEDLVQRDGFNFEAKFMLAGVYERMNRLTEADALVQSVAVRGDALGVPERQEVDHLFAKLALRKGDLVTARSLLERSGPRHANDIAHFFELAETYDKSGEQELAMQALRTTHAIQVEELKISSPDHFTPDALALPAAVPRVSPEAYRRWPQVVAPDARNSPVFIVGFPRSGTTLLEQMLDAHPALQSMDENPFFNRLADKLRQHDPRILQDLSVLQQRDCDELRKLYLKMVCETIERRWDAQVVDKNPLNMLWLPMIHRLFPEAKFIFALRHPCDVILSCYMQNFRASILGAAAESIPRLAAAYVQAVEHWLQDEQTFQPNVLVSRYEDLVTDFPPQTRRIAQFLELEDATPMLKFDQHARNKEYIATPSYSQVIVPVNKKGMNRWLRYRKEFEPAWPILQPVLRHWGYPTELGD
ncbi:tetratricopeptide repeat-containing sulfotransferase family protein [Rhodanobacter sp. MP7CTX1]|uniref:tetratricopeptide repeat-containing sulfotransferase family protein n=1 Tax=Rhodanobacter sp. MP7CTX1 TaxID=2723084 RepID=UPI0016139174|nr:tetratricopeptide repeat-containing sulfotransferase family protein [Rhodanobacter sp. MP7CTX1]MBB6189603.1 Flp pilus assembly protein TadD [Rhodanobacter sp. MP7CTX1]